MTDDARSAGKKTAALIARNKKLALDYVEALRRRDRAAVEAILSQNFRFLRLNDRLSRFEYLDSLERTIFSQNEPRLDVLFIAGEGDSVSIEILLEFDFEGRRLQGRYNSIYVIEDSELYEMREYGGITEFPA